MENGEGVHIEKMGKEGISEEVAFKQRHEGGKE